MRVEVRGAPKDLGGNLIFLEPNPWMLQCMICQVSQELAQRLGAVEHMAVHQPLNLEKAQLHLGYMVCHTHLTEGNRVFLQHARQQLRME
jgi:hypothetical protein